MRICMTVRLIGSLLPTLIWVSYDCADYRLLARVWATEQGFDKIRLDFVRRGATGHLTTWPARIG